MKISALVFVCEEWRNAGLSGRDSTQTYDEQTSLLYIKASEESSFALLRAAQRIRRNIRQGDTVLLLEGACLVILPATPLVGAQAVARRVSLLLADVPCELQVLYGFAAVTFIRRVQAEQAREVSREEDAEEMKVGQMAVGQRSCDSGRLSTIADSTTADRSAPVMPYLAFLSNYPSPRLLHLFPYELACRYQCIPVGAERDMLTVGTSQWLDHDVISHFQEVTRRGIFQVRCEASMIDDVLRYWQRLQ